MRRRSTMPPHLLLVCALALIALPVAASSPVQDDPPPSTKPDEDEKDKKPIEKVTIKGKEFKLELALDAEARAQGLMGREKLEENEGMLFVYRRAAHRSFWMKDCLIDLDIIYLDSRGRIVAMHEMKVDAPQGEDEPYIKYLERLHRYPSGRPAQYVIELKSGMNKKLELEVGEIIELDRRKLSRMAK